MTVFIYLLATVIEISFPCYYGSEIIASSEKLSTSLFHSEWFKQDKQFTKSMLIFMEKVKKPIKISVYGLYDLDLSYFTAVCNSAYSLFAVLNKINK